MKTWQKIVRLVSAVALIVVAAFFLNQIDGGCCLCDGFRYHSPCLVDLETSQVVELDLYFPHPSKVAELAEQQPEQSTFSLVRLGEASGYKDTGSKRVEVDIPSSSQVAKVSLCRKCKSQLDGLFLYDRYVLADLYDADNKIIIPITDGLDTEIRCYEISVTKEDGTLKLIVQGNLE